jgi:hypothetical protein
LQLPPTVQGLLAARIDRLPADVKTLLQTLAVLGKEFAWSLLTAVAGPKPCHHFLYSGGAFVRLYPVNLTPTRNHAAKPKRRPRGRYRFALDMW